MNLCLKFFILLFVCKSCKSDFCQYNFTLSDLQNSIIEEVLSLILDSGLVFSCATPAVDSSLINFWLYTNTDRSGTKLNASSPLMSFKKTIILVHGWLCNITNALLPELKEAYLNKYDANVIIVDWSYYAAKTYGLSYCHLPYIANVFASFLSRLENNLGILVNSIHVVAHSMGAQLSGLAGQNLKSQYNKTLGRLTALDPAGPLFVEKPINQRLDKTDAAFVDVIHTNAYVVGYGFSCGHVDFYPGCGTLQNGCDLGISNLSPLDFVVQKFSCDHLRSVDYMIESVSSVNFKGRGCLFCPMVFCYNAPMSVMGEFCSPSSQYTSYYLYTNAQKPFAQG